MSVSFPADAFHKMESIEESAKRFSRVYQTLTNLPTIPAFFENRDILITGSSSYLGKVLIEKILRSCPKVGKIFLLMRSSDEDSAVEKFCRIKNSSVFDVLRSLDPLYQRKIHVVEGDLLKIRLGLSTATKFKLSKVSIVFHLGAAKYDEGLSSSILTNVRGTRELLEFATLIKGLKLFCYISSVLSGLSESADLVDEIVQPSMHDWNDMIKICESTDETLLNPFEDICNGFLGNISFSKNLAENVVKDYARKFPVLIMRPAMILFPIKEPIPGWLDEQQSKGPIGFVLANAVGSLRSKNKTGLNWIPVDTCVKMILSATWKHANLQCDGVPVYNCSFDGKMTFTLEQIYHMGTSSLVSQIPLVGQRVESSSMMLSRLSHFYGFLGGILHKLSRGSIKLLHSQDEFNESLKSYRKFFTRKLLIKNEKIYELTREIRSEDVLSFDFENDHLLDFTRTMKNAFFALRRFVFKLEDENVEIDREKMEEKKNSEFKLEIIILTSILVICLLIFSSYFELIKN